jgi:hypothetical protein
MKRARRRLICTVLGFGMVLGLLALPAPVIGCTCAGKAGGDVVFVGTATNGPGSILGAVVPELAHHAAGTYTFSVEQVLRGDASDARVFTPSGGGECGRDFVIGATYEVHADYGAYWLGRYTFDAPLVTTICLQGSELRPASALGFLSYRPTNLGLIVVGLVIAGAVALRRFRARATAASK